MERMELGVGINRISSESSISYVFCEENIFSETKYKIFKGQLEDWFLRSAKILYNGKVKLVYVTSKYKSLRHMQSYLKDEEVLTIMINLLSIINAIQENGFLDYRNLDLTMDSIFIEQNTLGVKLIYLPLVQGNSVMASEHDLRQELVEIIRCFPIWSSEKIQCIYREVSNERQSLIAAYREICSRYGQKTKPTQEKEEKKSGFIEQPKKDDGETVLIVSSCETNTVFKINKDEFIIGRGGDISVDGVIKFNNAIGRSHCKFVCQDGEYCVSDLNSMNHTYLNGMQLMPNKLYRVLDGDILRLANSNFRIQIQRG